MKILVALNYYYPYVSGLSEYARLLCEELVQCGNDITVITSNQDQLPEKEIINGVKVVRAPILLKISKGTISPKFIMWIIKYAQQADVVHLHLPMLESGIVTQFIPKNKIICTYHCDINLPQNILNKIILRIMDISNGIALKRAKSIVVNTIDYTKKSRIAYNYINKMTEIAPPIKKLPVIEKKKHLGFKIGFCGRIVEEKGIDVLIKAFELLQKEKSNINLIIGGDYKAVAGGSVYPKLKEYIERFDIKNIKFVGKIPEEKMADFYASLDVFILPSINSLESFGMVQVEAMLCGTPVIASDLPGVKSVVERTGMGLICKHNNVEHLKQCIVQIMDNYDQYLRNRSQIEAYYSTEKCVSKYMEIFQKFDKS